jgi:hypothetical protein
MCKRRFGRVQEKEDGDIIIDRKKMVLFNFYKLKGTN